MRCAVVAAVLLTFTPSLTLAQAPSSADVNHAIDAAERICLVGNRYKFQVDASGNLTISKLLPGAAANVTVDRAEAKGSQFFENEEVRRLVDQDIRDCMKGQWAAVLPYLAKQNSVNLPIQPIGEVADHWKTDNDLRLTLMPSGDQKLLNNLRIGPAVGTKQEIMRKWCGADETGACVKCTPENPTETTNYVEIQLRPNPKVEREQLPGVWPNPPAGRQPEPWQLVDPDGKRFVYVCKHNQARAAPRRRRSAKSPVRTTGTDEPPRLVNLLPPGLHTAPGSLAYDF